jgi:hypothetical protein
MFGGEVAMFGGEVAMFGEGLWIDREEGVEVVRSI